MNISQLIAVFNVKDETSRYLRRQRNMVTPNHTIEIRKIVTASSWNSDVEPGRMIQCYILNLNI